MAEAKKKEVVKSINDETKKKVKKESKPVKKSEKKTNKKSLWERFMIFCNGVKGEIEKVHWTSKKDMLTFSIATIVFVIFCSLFFYLIEVLFALLQSLL